MLPNCSLGMRLVYWMYSISSILHVYLVYYMLSSILHVHVYLVYYTIPLVMPMTPALEPTISMQKSGAWPVMPNMVVLRYFSCPARSIKVTTFEAALQMCTQSRDPAGGTDRRRNIIALKITKKKKNLNNKQILNRHQTPLTVSVCLVDHPALLVEAQDVVANAGRSPALHLMFVPEQLLPGCATAVVQLTVCEHPQQSALTGIHIAHHRHPV